MTKNDYEKLILDMYSWFIGGADYCETCEICDTCDNYEENCPMRFEFEKRMSKLGIDYA